MRTFDVPLPIGLLRSLRPLVASANDPTIRLRPDRLVRSSRTPEGPVTLDVRKVGDQRFEARADGPGATWALAQAPELFGVLDDLDGFVPAKHPMVARLHHRRADLRMIRSGQVTDLLVQTILAQRVTSIEAARSWTRLVKMWGEPAPGPIGLRLPPAPEQLAQRPYHDYHRLGVERGRAERIIRASRFLASRSHLTAAADLDALQAIPGVGPWTAALVARTAGGDADAVEIGDYHVKNQIAYALSGEARGTDQRMLELLEPFAGHRGRVVRLVVSAAPRPPAFGPRQRIVPVEEL